MEKYKTTPMPLERLEWLRERGYTADSIYKYAKAEPLKEKLFEIGGEGVVILSGTKEVSKLVKHGVLFDGTDARLWKLKVRGCHENTDWIVEKYPHFFGYTGYALSLDGVWRYHSFAFDTDRNQILETTEKRLAYFAYKH